MVCSEYIVTESEAEEFCISAYDQFNNNTNQFILLKVTDETSGILLFQTNKRKRSYKCGLFCAHYNTGSSEKLNDKLYTFLLTREGC